MRALTVFDRFPGVRVSVVVRSVTVMSTAQDFLPPDPGGPGLHAAVTRLADAAEAARAVLTPDRFAGVSDQVAATAAVQLSRVAQLASAGAAVGLGRVADSGYPTQQGFVSAGSWWRVRTRAGKDDAADQVRLARRLRRHYQATTTAWVDGAITGAHAEVIATGIDAVLHRLARRERRDAATAGVDLDRAALAATLAAARAGLEAELLTLAVRWGPETLRVALAHARLAADPDGASQEQMDAADDARLSLVEVGDMAVLTAQVSKELAAQLRTILDHYRDRLHHTGITGTDSGPDSDSPGPDRVPDGGGPHAGGPRRPDDTDPVTGDPVVRSNAHRDADALGAWVDATLGGGLGSNPASERPHLDVVVSLADLADGTGTAVLDRLGVPAPVSTAQRVGCDADVRVVLVDGIYRDPHTGQVVEPAVAALLIAGAGVLDYGRARRIVPPALRRLLGHRDRGCAFPGCHRPPQHCQAHHVVPWERGGPTNLENCVLLCSRHHHFVHDGRWTMLPRDDVPYWQPGHWRFLPPPRTARL